MAIAVATGYTHVSSRTACPQSRYWQFLGVLDNVNRNKLSDQLYLFDDKINTKISLKRE